MAPLLLLLSALAASPPPPPAPTADVAELQARARAQGLARQDAWLRLLHYVPTWRGLESEADGPAFFLAKDGKRDPQAELDATLAAFFAPVPAGKPESHARCRFPARLMVLAQALQLDAAALPQVECKGLSDFVQRLAPRAVHLVFSSYYVNNPSSAFGHTFLRFARAGSEVAVGEAAELLDWGVDYSGVVDTSNPLIYGVKGMTGLFDGKFNHYPYFYKVREYNEYESRDLWEYELALEPHELGLLLLHLWEVGGTSFDYYYLSENCSYRIIAVLDAAAPRLKVLERLRYYYVLPGETVRAVHDTPGLVRAVRYRPSIRTQFRARAAALSGAEQAQVDALARDDAAALSGAPERQVAVLDAALDLVDLREAKTLVHRTSREVSAHKQRLMERRASLRVPSPPLVVPPPYERQPQRARPNQRLLLGAGGSSRTGPTLQYGLRFALRDLADPHAGVPELAQIEFLHLRFAADLREPAVRLESLTLVQVLSLSPLDRFDRAPSWTVRLGVDRLRERACDGCTAAVGEAGGGLAVSGFGGALTLYALSEAAVHAGPSVPGLFGTGLRPSVGPHVGARLRLGTRATFVAAGRWRAAFGKEVQTGWGAEATGRLHLLPSLGLELSARRHPDAEREAVLGALVYF